MSNIEYSTKLIRNGSTLNGAIPSEISCVFRFGKNDLNDQTLSFDLLDELENDHMLIDRNDDKLTLNSLAREQAIENIKKHLKPLPSLQVRSFDGLPISVFNSEALPSATSANYTNLEASVNLPTADANFLQQLLENDPNLTDIDFDQDFFKEIFPETSELDNTNDIESDMTINQITNQPSLELPSSNEQIFIQEQLPISSISAHRSSVSSSSAFSDLVDHEETVESPKTIKTNGAAGKFARFGNKKVVKYSDEYHERRIKNNIAVKNSRLKAKEKQKTSEVQMNKLIEENLNLTERVDLLMKELQVLRSLYKELKNDRTNGKTQTKELINKH